MTVANTAAGIAELVATLKQFVPVARIIYKRLALKTLPLQGFPMCQINALHIRHFAWASGRLAKTDRIDALVLVNYGQRMETSLAADQDEVQETLAELVSRYRQLTHIKKQSGTFIKLDNIPIYWTNWSDV
ncbi:transposase [uncultured Thalassospira sp.]|uniref:IS110 family transposase n=1 Tax=uncultured Thalassospira sp. TaxID=404382 RepID=UPI0030D89FC9